MKKKLNIKRNIITLGIIFVSLSIINYNIFTDQIGAIENRDDSNLKNLRNSGFWMLNNITIDGSATGVGAKNWTWAANQPWCNGIGTYADPYLIENITIDAFSSSTGIGIEIKNSRNDYFIINNCTVFTTNPNPTETGIKLGNTNKGMLNDTEVSYFRYTARAIFLSNSDNNTITGNNAHHNIVGILLASGSNNNRISGNNIYKNRDGIFFSNGNHYNTISENTINDNSDNGIFLFGGNTYNTISGNNISYNDDYGIRLLDSDYNTIVGNNASYNYAGGMYLEYSCRYENITGNTMNEGGLVLSGTLDALSSYDIDTTNLVNGKPLYYLTHEVNLAKNNFTDAGQVILVNCSDSLITDLNISKSSYGISLYFCSNIKFSGNNASYNLMGIYLYRSDNNNISGNIANDNNNAIYLHWSSNNSISGNNANGNNNGISLRSNSYENTVSGNNVSDNTNIGIFLRLNCYENTVSGNTANQNRLGIYLRDNCYENTVLGNIIKDNTDNGIYLFDNCNNNTITENVIRNNTQNGIDLSGGCEGNFILRNTIDNNGTSLQDYGISLTDSNDNTIMGNTLFNNSQYGVSLDVNSESNLIFVNNFIGNGYHAIDNGNNQWDDGYTGNYWDNYSGFDLYPKDGVGDFPYYSVVGGKYDTRPLLYPIWEDTDGEGLINLEEYTLGEDGYRTNILNSDSDEDGLSDYWEWQNFTNPVNPDTDGDSIIDGDEINFGTDPVNPDTDSDSFNDDDEFSLGTDPLDPLWYPMPNLKVSHFSSVVAYKSTSFVLDFSIDNDGIWKAFGVIVVVRCEELGLTLFNNTNSPFNLEVNETEYISIGCSPFENVGDYTLNLTVNPYNTIGEIYSMEDGSLRPDWEIDNSNQANLSIILIDEFYTLMSYLEGNATLVQKLLDWSNGNASLIDTIIIQLEQNATLLQQVIGWLGENATEIEQLFTYLNGNATLLVNVVDNLEHNSTLIQKLVDWSNGNSSLIDTIILQLEQNATLVRQVIGWLGENATEIDLLFTYLKGNATQLFEVVNYLDGNATLLTTVHALATQNSDYLSTINGTLSGRIDDIRAIVDELGITISDTDYDGLDDLDELSYGTNPTMIDTDLDNLNDAFEIKYGTDPLDDDSDDDGHYDGIEIASGTDPLDPEDFPGKIVPDGEPNVPLVIVTIIGVVSAVSVGILAGVFFYLKKRKVE